MEQEYINQEDINQFRNILARAKNLKENDIKTAFELSVESLQVYYRWIEIKYNIKKDLKRGEAVALKELLEDKCNLLKEVYTFSRMIWKQANDNLRGRSGE